MVSTSPSRRSHCFRCRLSQAHKWPTKEPIPNRASVLTPTVRTTFRNSKKGELLRYPIPLFPFPPGASRGGRVPPHAAKTAAPPTRGISKRSAEIPLVHPPVNPRQLKCRL